VWAGCAAARAGKHTAEHANIATIEPVVRSFGTFSRSGESSRMSTNLRFHRRMIDQPDGSRAARNPNQCPPGRSQTASPWSSFSLRSSYRRRSTPPQGETLILLGLV